MKGYVAMKNFLYALTISSLLIWPAFCWASCSGLDGKGGVVYPDDPEIMCAAGPVINKHPKPIISPEGQPLERLADWSVISGVTPSKTGWKEQGHVLTMFDCNAVESWLAYKNVHGVNGYVQGTFIFTSTLSNLFNLPLVVRAIDDNNMLGLRMNGDDYEVVERVGGTWTTIASIDNPAVGDVVRLSINGGDIEVTINGAVAWTGTTTLAESAGYFGLYTHTWSAGDNVSYIRDFSAGLVTGSCPDNDELLTAYADTLLAGCADTLLNNR